MRNTAPAIQVGRGTRLAGVQRLHQQGPLEQTGRNLDIAIEGEGFFQIRMPTGETAYTRDGSFQISDQGVLVTSGGQALDPPIRVPDRRVPVDDLDHRHRDGASRQGHPAHGNRAHRARRLRESVGTASRWARTCYAPTACVGAARRGLRRRKMDMGRLQQGSLEGSNVEIVQEMVEMISAMRAYEINSKAIKTADEMGQIANNITR